MRNTLLYFLAALVIFPVMAQQQPEWQSQYAVGLNKLAPHTYVWPYQTVSDIRNGDYESSPYYMSLNGSWKFHWVKNPDNRPKDFYKPEFYTGGWADIQVPGNWERQGYGTAIYVNETYEFDDKLFHFKKNPPLVPYKENEVGSYRRTFTIPADWEDRRVVICCEGVISFYFIWVNGHLLGYNQGSKTPAEWDITDKLKKGENTVALEVYRWSAGSYLECQDMWRLSGIERDVYLYSTPKQYIADYKVTSSLDKQQYKEGIFGLEATIEGPSTSMTTFAYRLEDKTGKAVLQGEYPIKSKGLSHFLKLDEQSLPDVEVWSAEHPNLYTLILELKDVTGKVTELTGCEVGFRTSEIKDGRFCINGVPVLVKGTNRHEHSQLALDKQLRKQMQLEIKAIHNKFGLTTISVTHDQEEALTMATKVCVMKEAKIQQIDTPEMIYDCPVNTFVANFIGESTVIPATIRGIREGKITAVFDKDDRLFEVDCKRRDYWAGLNKKVNFIIRPEKVKIVKEDYDGIKFPARITSCAFLGDTLPSKCNYRQRYRI